MKILFLMNSGFDTPGPSNHLLESIIKRLLEKNHKIHIIEKNNNGSNSDIPESILHKNLTYNTIKSKVVIKTNFFRRYLNDVIYAFKCVKYYREKNRYDAIFLQSCNVAIFHIILLKLFIKAPIIFNVQDIFPMNALLGELIGSKGLIYRILRFLQNKSYQYSDKIITISDDMKNTLVDEGIEDNKISVIYNWTYSDEKISINDLDNIFVKKYRIDTTEYKIVYAGNIGILQNVEMVIDAAIELKNEDNIKFYIIGDGAKKEHLVNKVEEYNLNNVRFFPMQDAEYAQHIYSMADVNIIPLKKGIIKVALPSKTAICLATEKPIIACIDEDSTFSEVIKMCDKCMVVDSDDPQALSTQILNYYLNNVRSKSKNSYEVFKLIFSKNKNTNKYVNIIESIKK